MKAARRLSAVGVACRASAAAAPMAADSSGTAAAKAAISATGRKPHMPSKAVSAMAISGLWLLSG